VASSSRRAGAAPISFFSLDPSSQSASLGSTVSLGLDVSGLGNGTALGTYNFDIGFDPTVLAYSNVTFGTELDPDGYGPIQFVFPGALVLGLRPGELFALRWNDNGQNSLRIDSSIISPTVLKSKPRPGEATPMFGLRSQSIRNLNGGGRPAKTPRRTRLSYFHQLAVQRSILTISSLVS
jgi:hypothetical protein